MNWSQLQTIGWLRWRLSWNRFLRAGNFNALLSFLFLSLLVAGCNRQTKAPEPFPIAEVPAALQTAFGAATGESAQAVSNLLVAAASGADIDALALTDDLLQTPTLSREQRKVAVRCKLTFALAIQAAAEKGDQHASAELKYRHDTK